MPDPTFTAAPTDVPSRAVPSTFSVLTDPFLAWTKTFRNELSSSVSWYALQVTTAAQSVTDAATQVGLAVDQVTLATTQVGLATDQVALATTQADNAAASAAAAVVTANAALWVSADPYAEGANAISLVDFGTYRAITTHTGVATDPSADATNWTLISAGAGSSVAALTPAATVDISLADADYFTITLDQDTTFTVSNVEAVDTFNLAITGVDVATGYDIPSASYDSVSFSVASQETSPQGLAFNTDGTKMYIVGITSDSVFQYTLSTAFDLSTASYGSVSFSVASENTEPYDLTFSNDGTKMFIMGSSPNEVFQYTLSTAFDLSTASYDSVSFSVSSQGISPQGIAFNSDGTKMYMVGNNENEVFQYTLSTAFDLSTASYDSVSFSVASQETSPQGIAFNSDGTKMYMVGISSDTLYQYTLTTGFDLSTASYDSVSFSLVSEEAQPRGITFNATGTKMYIVGSTGDSVYQYTTQIVALATITFPASFEFTSGATPAAPANGVTDILEAQTTNGGATWYVTELGYAPAIPASLSTVQDTKLDTASTSSTSFTDTGLEVVITLADASHKVALFVSIATGTENALGVFFRVVRDGTDIALGVNEGSRTQASFVGGSPDTDTVSTTAFSYVDSPASVGPHTYKIQWRTSSQASYINRSHLNGTGQFRSRPVATLIAMERE
jgi:sugar lactone lactonase YvrE